MDWIIGVGNRLRGDDGLGPRLVERVRAAKTAKCLVVTQLTPELALSLRDADRVLFVDADVAETAPRLLRLEPRTDRGLGHALSPEGLLELTERAFGTAPDGWLLSIPGHRFEFVDELSTTAAGALCEAERILMRWMERTAVTIDV